MGEISILRSQRSLVSIPVRIVSFDGNQLLPLK